MTALPVYCNLRACSGVTRLYPLLVFTTTLPSVEIAASDKAFYDLAYS